MRRIAFTSNMFRSVVGVEPPPPSQHMKGVFFFRCASVYMMHDLRSTFSIKYYVNQYSYRSMQQLFSLVMQSWNILGKKCSENEI